MNLFQPTQAKRVVFFIVIDLFVSFLTLFLAYQLRFNFHVPEQFFGSFPQIFILLGGLKILMFSIFRVYLVPWRFFGLQEAKKLLWGHLLAYSGSAGIFVLFYDTFAPFARSILLMDLVLSYLAIGVFRISKRVYIEKERGINELHPPSLIIGANSKASNIIKAFLNQDLKYYPVAIIDDKFKGANFSNLRVYGFDQLELLVEKYNIKAALLTENYESATLAKLFEKLLELGIEEIKLAQIVGDKEKLKAIAIEDLLARHPKDLDPALISAFIKDKKVLITGAGGSIGSEIARQCQRFGAASLLLLDHAEFNLYTIKEELPQAEARLVSVTNAEELRSVFEAFRPQIVIHAAAYKHVPLCEENVESAIKNNILGTMNVVDLSINSGVQKLVIISTDKAVRPTNVMGATKRVTELYAQNIDSKETEIVAVRFGNVLGSSGSVIPKFRQQIEQGGPVTVTHPEMTRYFMLIPEACQLVLQAASIAKGNELFILDMGEPVKIVDLATKMIQLYGKEGEVNIEFSGLRPGEKLYEELMLDESEQKTKYESIFVARATKYEIERLKKDIEELFVSENKIEALQKIVPEFERRANERGTLT